MTRTHKCHVAHDRKNAHNYPVFMYEKQNENTGTICAIRSAQTGNLLRRTQSTRETRTKYNTHKCRQRSSSLQNNQDFTIKTTRAQSSAAQICGRKYVWSARETCESLGCTVHTPRAPRAHKSHRNKCAQQSMTKYISSDDQRQRRQRQRDSGFAPARDANAEPYSLYLRFGTPPPPTCAPPRRRHDRALSLTLPTAPPPRHTRPATARQTDMRACN